MPFTPALELVPKPLYIRTRWASYARTCAGAYVEEVALIRATCAIFWNTLVNVGRMTLRRVTLEPGKRWPESCLLARTDLSDF
jgi:hypothetical protein